MGTSYLSFDPSTQRLSGQIGALKISNWHAESGGHATAVGRAPDWRANNILSPGSKNGGVIPMGKYSMSAHAVTRGGKPLPGGCIWLESPGATLWGRDGLLIHVMGGKRGSEGCIVIPLLQMTQLFAAVLKEEMKGAKDSPVLHVAGLMHPKLEQALSTA